MYCNRCGQQIEVGSIFCTNCGLKINGNQNTVNKKKININTILIILISLITIIILIGGINYILKLKQSRTIMIYMVGTDLETSVGLASRDLQDLDYNKTSNNNTKVVLIAGGTKTWKNDYIDSDETSIYELKESGFVKVAKRNIENMGNSKNLTYFLNYVYENYKTSKYDLLFWNHGGAVDGSEYDELAGNFIKGNDNLKPTEMKEALEKSKFNKNNKIEVVSFRTCLNATIEIANVFKDYAKYMVASEEVTVGSIFDSALKFINNVNNTDNGIDYGNKQIESYKETVTTYCNYSSRKNLSENYCLPITYSLIDLSKINKLNKDLDIFAQQLNNKLPSNYNNLSKIRSNLNQYASDEPSYDMIDLYEFIDKNKEYSNNADEVIKSINSTIITNFSNNNYSHGLSIYNPYNNTLFLDGYEKISEADNYNKYINNFVNMKRNIKAGKLNSISNKEGILKETNKDKADFELELTDEEKKNFAKATYTVFVDTKDGYYKRLYTGKTVKLEGNKIKATVQGKMLRFSDIEYDDDNCWINMVEKEVTDDYVEVLTFPILHKGFDYTNSTVTIRIDDKHPNGYIVSTVINNKSKSSSMALFSEIGSNISDYTYITYASQKYKIVDENGLFNPNYEGNGVYTGLELLTNGFKFIKEDFDSEYDYYAVFKIWDIANNIYYSRLVKMN